MWKQGTIEVKDSNGRMVSVTFWVKHYEKKAGSESATAGLPNLCSSRTAGLFTNTTRFTNTARARKSNLRPPKLKRHLQY